MARTVAELVADRPPGFPVTAEQIAELARAYGRVWLVLDDDPTGSQSVHDLPVVLDWTSANLEWALRLGAPAVYIITNTRSLDPAAAEQRNREVVRAAFGIARRLGIDLDLVSRSDSTLRGHFPLEPRVLAEESASAGRPVDAVVVVPAFPEAGRVTVDGIHYATTPDGPTPVGDTEFARDPTFGFTSSDLRRWIAEKSGGRISAEAVTILGLDSLRQDPQGSLRTLLSVRDGRPIVCDAASAEDLLRLAAALHAATLRGGRFVYRVAPAFIRAMIGQQPRQPLTSADIAGLLPVDAAPGGLIVAGSHVALSTRQLDVLGARRDPFTVELDVGEIASGGFAGRAPALAGHVATALHHGDVVLQTSRVLHRTATPEGSLGLARAVSDAVVDVVAAVTATVRPRFVIAKGGITSSDVASRALGIGRALVRGPMLPGIVSLWEPADGTVRGTPYVVFPGNVGGPDALADVVDKLGVPAHPPRDRS